MNNAAETPWWLTNKKRCVNDSSGTKLTTKRRKREPRRPLKDIRHDFVYFPNAVDGCEFKKEVEKYFPAERSNGVAYGQTYTVPRDMVMMQRDLDMVYMYSGVTVPSCSYTPVVDTLQQQVESIASSALGRVIRFDVVLINGYNSGDGVGAHRDDEPIIDQNEPIASLSFGGERDFDVDADDGKRYRVTLRDGDVVIMMPGAQSKYKHSIPIRKGKHVKRRYNLTFRANKREDGSRYLRTV